MIAMRSTKLRPSPLMLISGIVLLLSGLSAPYIDLMFVHETPFIGSAAFLWFYMFCYIFILYGMMLISLSFFGFLRDEPFRGCCRPKTTVTALLLGATWAAECFCFTLSATVNIYKHPIRSAVIAPSIYAGLLLILVLAVIYLTARKASFSVKGLLVDVLMMLITFLPAYYAIEQIYLIL